MSKLTDRLKANNAMDFDDLLLNTVKLFKNNEEVLDKYRRRFRYVMVDEYQDTNHIQYELVSMLAGGHHNICVVGDDDQCIYEWRGADIRNIEEEYKDVMTLRRTNSRNDSRFTTYIFDCHLNNSYEVLRLADKLQKRDDINWADADKYSPVYFDI